VLAGFAAAVACLVAMTGGTLWLDAVRDEQALAVQRTQETILLLHDVRGLFRTAATSLHAILGDAPEWERDLSQRVGDELEPAVERLAALVEDEPDQVARCRQLRPLLSPLDHRSRAALVAQARGDEGRARRLLDGVGPTALSGADVIIGEMERQEQARLALRQQRWRIASTLGAAGFAAAAALLLALILLAARAVRAESAARERLSAGRAETVALQQQIMAIVGHDLRNPLLAMKASAEVLARAPGLDDHRREDARLILAGARRMERLLRDLIDFARLRAGRGLPVERATADLVEVCRRAVEDLGREAEERVVVEGQGETGGAWDAGRVEQVVVNLVSNALKYGPPGGPVTVRVEGQAGEVVLTVRDEGGGLEPRLQEAIFEPFRRLKAGDAHAARSAGLGLFIVRQIAEAHGGTAAVDSAPGRGTTFTVRLPRPPGR
jgi:signal transduction histidine kinase